MIDTPPPGFGPFDPSKPVIVTRRHLPHWRQDGATYFVTFRLADSLPHAKRVELEALRAEWLKQCPCPSDEEVETHAVEIMQRVDKWLDQGYGSCVLRQPYVADIAESCLRHFQGVRYSLFSYAIMPNHIHACVRPLQEWKLADVLKGWKSVSSRQINRVLGQHGQRWQQESFDRIVRDSAHLRRIVRYIEGNPEKASVPARCWTDQEWDAWLGRGSTDR